MDAFSEAEGPVMLAAATAGEIPPPHRRSVRRRLVQSTLVAHKPPEPGSNGAGEKECNRKDEDFRDEEYTASQGKKKRARKGKATPQSKTPRKNEKSPRKGKLKISAQSSHGDELMTTPIPNLRLEAKLMAEETSRIFAGKGIHPFFSTWKGSKKSDEEGVEVNYCVPEGKESRVEASIAPIHVFEKDQDDDVHIDWRNWEFCDRSFANCSYSVLSMAASASDGSSQLLCVDKISGGLGPAGTLTFQDDGYLDHGHCQQELLQESPATICASTSHVPFDAQVPCCQLVKDAERDCKFGEVGLTFGCSGKSNIQQQNDLVQERIMSSYLGCLDKIEERLWTDKYQPRKAMEVCGNVGPVKFLSEWLRNWQQGGYHVSKDSFGDECNMHDADYSCLQSESDSENANDVGGLKNVLLLTGPVGCGKSAAIYACAKEQGFKVLEVNSSDCRSGAMVKQRFGEALGSHSLEWSQDSQMEPLSRHDMNFSMTSINSKMIQEFDNEVLEVFPKSDEDKCNGVNKGSMKLICKDSSISAARIQLKHLILFEDVDVTFAEDRGFVAAIQQIADKAKGPVILTSNNEKPILPSNLDRLEVSFMMPSRKELLQHANMVCSEEKANIQPHQIEQLVEYCQGDIRKTIMHLQLWSQGGEVQRLFGPLPFDPEVGHQMLPKLIPWDFPSQLSEVVEKEISMSLSKMEELSPFLEVIKEEFGSKPMQDNFMMESLETGSLEAKKEAMLRRNCTDNDYEDFKSPFDASCDFFNPTGTPISFSRRNRRRKLDVVLSSDSEDELVNSHFPLHSEKDANSELDFEVSGRFSSCCPTMRNCLWPSMDLQLCSEVYKLEKSCYEHMKMTSEVPINEMHESSDLSCVPESSFVPETEINNVGDALFDRVSIDQMADDFEEVSVCNGSKPSLSPVEFGSLDIVIPKFDKDCDRLGSTCNTVGVSSYEEMEDSQNGHMKDLKREYQVMDECSRIDFNRKCKVAEKLGSSAGTNLVLEAWRKLRDHHTDLRHIVALERNDASGILKLASGMSNLISEAELLLSNCWTDDSLESEAALSEVSDARRWCDEQLQLTSAIAQHGFSVYAKDIAAVELKLDAECRMDLIWDMLSSSGLIDFGSFAGQELNNKTQGTGLVTGMKMHGSGASLMSETKSCFSGIIQSIVPSRLYLMMKGDSLYEYLSSLGQISRSEASRLSEGIEKRKGRRRRAAQNYLNTGSLSLSPEEISLLGQLNLYSKISSQSEVSDRTCDKL